MKSKIKSNAEIRQRYQVSYPIRLSCLLSLAVILAVVSSAVNANARPAGVFAPYLQEIQSSLPPGLAMRLPSEIRLDESAGIKDSQIIVRIFPSKNPLTLTVSLFTCDLAAQPCLVGSFSVDSKTSVNAVQEFQKHQASGNQITLSPKIRGYLLEGLPQKPSYRFSSVMWEQDGMFYRASFPAIERRNLLFMAYSMAHETPMRPIAPPSSPSQRFGF
jgi:hypothetical protein